MSNKVKTNFKRGTQTVMGLERASSIADIRALEKQENAVIADMIANGYEDPRLNKGHSRCLMGQNPAGQTVRRYITHWGYGGPEPTANQVKDKQTSDEWVQELKAQIVQHGGLKLVPLKSESNEIVNGHTRKRCLSEVIADPKTKAKLNRLKEHGYKMPWATVTDTYVLDQDGRPASNTSKRESNALDFLSRVWANPPKENDEYNRESVKTQIDMFYAKDPHCLGMNPTGGLLYNEKDPDNEETRTVYDNVMDYVYKKESWTDKAQRTLIQRDLHKDRSVCKDIFAAEINEEAAVRGWPSGLVTMDPKNKNQKKSIKQIGDWTSACGRVLYADLATIGKHLLGKIGMYLDQRLRDFTLNKLDAVKLVMRVSGTKTTVEGLNAARKKYLKDNPEKLNREFATWNRAMDEILATMPPGDPARDKIQKYPYIEEVSFVEQLLREGTSAKDPGLYVKWDEKLERFRNQATGDLI
jgi:hypothetical protein